VVDDGSTQPRTLEVLAVLRESGYHIIEQPNAGLAAARNCGIHEARGRYILPLDADNRLAAGYIKSAIQVLDNQPETGVVYGDRLEFGCCKGRKPVPAFDLPTLLWSNYIDACAAYRHEIWEDCGGYDAGVPAWEDWDFWISIAERGWQFHRLSDIAFEYRIRPNSMLRNAEREGLRQTVREHIYRKHHQIFAKNLTEFLMVGHTGLNAAFSETLKLRESHDHLQHDIDLIADDARAVRKSRDRLQLDIDLLAASVEHEREVLRTLQNELAACRQEIACMKSTCAWRLRRLLVRLGHRLRMILWW
jgi:glycosyltransferase involved in cell wall biosynthesis